jgi:hypothetical protein
MGEQRSDFISADGVSSTAVWPCSFLRKVRKGGTELG